MIVAVVGIFVVSSDPPIALFTIGCCYALSALFGPVGGIVTRAVPRRHLQG